jgi:hypothetical protein
VTELLVQFCDRRSHRPSHEYGHKALVRDAGGQHLGLPTFKPSASAMHSYATSPALKRRLAVDLRGLPPSILRGVPIDTGVLTAPHEWIRYGPGCCSSARAGKLFLKATEASLCDHRRARCLTASSVANRVEASGEHRWSQCPLALVGCPASFCPLEPFELYSARVHTVLL